jgi:hypothetical protein
VNDKRLEIAYIGLVVVMVVFIATVLFLAVMEMPVYGEAANPITAVMIPCWKQPSFLPP